MITTESGARLAPVQLTETAARRVASQIDLHNAKALRFAAKHSGCSGYSYVMDYAQTIEPNDTVFESYGVKVVVDEQSLLVVQGTQIDYVTEGLNHTFKFINPRATDECGCGESFAIEA